MIPNKKITQIFSSISIKTLISRINDKSYHSLNNTSLSEVFGEKRKVNSIWRQQSNIRSTQIIKQIITLSQSLENYFPSDQCIQGNLKCVILVEKETWWGGYNEGES